MNAIESITPREATDHVMRLFSDVDDKIISVEEYKQCKTELLNRITECYHFTPDQRYCFETMLSVFEGKLTFETLFGNFVKSMNRYQKECFETMALGISSAETIKEFYEVPLAY